MGESQAPRVRLAELVATLSLVSDLGMGQPMEHALRQCLIAMRLAERLGLDDHDREATYYTGLMAWVGCHVDAYEQAKWFGDEMAVKAGLRQVDLTSNTGELAFVLRHLGAGRPFLDRVRTGVALVAHGSHDLDVMIESHWRAVDSLAADLGLDEHVRKGLEQTFERWDGRGDPHGANGDQIVLIARLVNLADVVEVFHRAGGVEGAVAVARARRGTQFDPSLVDVFVDAAEDVLGDLDDVTTWDAVIAAEPRLGRTLSDAELDAALEAIADFTDVKSPYTLGHSRAVADLAGAAAEAVGLREADRLTVRRAGLLHDLGRMGVSNSIWDKPDPLTRTEAERVRLHPYLTERTLAASPGLAPLGALAVQNHERLDGSGYPRGLTGDSIGASGRILGASDAYRTKLEPRPHRPAASPAEAATYLRDEVRAGRLDGDAVEAVLGAAGHRARRRREAVGGLTAREVEVLRLLARGLPTKEIARRLGISRKTAANHVEHIYAKLGVCNRALASLFAVKHGLLEPDDAELAQDGGLA